MASGSSACAVTVASNRLGFTKGVVNIELDGGILSAEWKKDGVWLTGPTAFVFNGEVSGEYLRG